MKKRVLVVPRLRREDGSCRSVGNWYVVPHVSVDIVYILSSILIPPLY
jgi:hypothetical protein